MIHSCISKVQFDIFVTSSYSTRLFMNICPVIYFMYFYLRHHLTKIIVIKANLNVIQNFPLLSIHEKLPEGPEGHQCPGTFQDTGNKYEKILTTVFHN